MLKKQKWSDTPNQTINGIQLSKKQIQGETDKDYKLYFLLFLQFLIYFWKNILRLTNILKYATKSCSVSFKHTPRTYIVKATYHCISNNIIRVE